MWAVWLLDVMGHAICNPVVCREAVEVTSQTYLAVVGYPFDRLTLMNPSR